MPQTVTIQHVLSDEFLSDILHTACNRSIDYWAAIHDGWREDIISFLFIEDVEGGEGKRYTVTHESLAKAVQVVLTSWPPDSPVADAVRRDVLDSDSSQIDALAADALIQLACFGEIVYG